MSIHLKIATGIHQGALLAAAEATAHMPDGVSPALVESAQIHAAIAHVAAQIHDVPEGVLRQRVLITLSEQCGPGAATAGTGLGDVPQCDRCHAIGQEPRHDHDWNCEGVCRICGVDAIEGEL